MARRNFTKPARVKIVKRATRKVGRLSEQYCEKCGQPCKGRFEIHHLREDGLEVDKSKPLTAVDGALWCAPCHDEHTRKFSIPAIAKAKRREASDLRANSPKQPIRQRPKGDKLPAKAPVPGRTGVARQYVTLGDAASAVLAKLNKKKAAE